MQLCGEAPGQPHTSPTHAGHLAASPSGVTHTGPGRPSQPPPAPAVLLLSRVVAEGGPKALLLALVQSFTAPAMSMKSQELINQLLKA